MRPITEKVLQRLSHEKLLLVSHTQAQRSVISLEDFLEAAKEEPRIYSALAAILLYKPKIFRGFEKSLRKYPEIKTFVDELFLESKPKKKMFDHDKAFYQKGARTFKAFLDSQKTGKKSRSLFLRVSEEDLERLQKLTEVLKTGSISETIRSLAREKEQKLSLQA